MNAVQQVADARGLSGLPALVLDLKKATREFVDTAVLPHESEIGVTGQVPMTVTQHLKALGYYGLTIPEEYGGLGLRPVEYCAVLEELARAPKPVWNLVNVCNGVAARVLERYGTAEQKQSYLRGVAAGDVVPSITVTEPEAGSDVQALRTTARRADGGWLINGTKHFITFGDRSDCLFVLARTGRETGSGRKRFTFFVVRRDNPGLSVTRIQRSIAGPPYDQAELAFNDCYVADSDVLGIEGEGLKAVLTTFREERLSMAICALGTAQRAVELAIGHAKSRMAFGQRIGDYQAVQHLIVESATELSAARALTYQVVSDATSGSMLAHHSSMAKLFASEAAGRIVDRCLQVFGGTGYMEESPISRLYRDVRVMRLSGGTSEIQRNIIARALLDGH
jgi:alkylation response protein AidB-like acyl-CoA dehydrogenase